MSCPMTTHIDRALEQLGLTLPEAAAPVAAYVPVVEAGGLLQQGDGRGRQYLGGAHHA